MKNLVKKIIGWLPYNDALFKSANLYVSRFAGENGFKFDQNGELQLLQAVAPQIETAFDVGMNLGEWTVDLLQLRPDARVHGFEPSRTTFDRLTRHGFPPHVRLNHCGLSSQPGQATLHTFGDCAGTNSLYARTSACSVDFAATETIQLGTLDSYCREHGVKQIDFLKIDVEGHELEVLRGAAALLAARAIHRIQFEYGQAWSESRSLLKDAFDLLQPYGYQLYKITPHGCLPLPAYRQNEENYALKNYLALAPGVELPAALRM